ncbi:MAG: T9SS type A sorting domain-containing protein [Cytophagales bacterium]|nr:T9SS type A sorting domain-containing protein [Cytophagales bacterium]
MKHLLKKFCAGSLLITLLLLSQGLKAQDTLWYNCTGMAPHNGQLFEFRLLDVNWMEIGRAMDTVAGGTVMVWVEAPSGLVALDTFYLEYYADHDTSGGYTFPGDHAWRDTLVAAGGDTTIWWVHNPATIMDIMWPVTGINELHPNITKVQIFPNPARGAFNLNLVLTDHEKVMIKIFSVEGKLVFARHLGSITGHNSIELNLSDQSAGLYHLQIITDKGTVSKEVVIK